MANSVLSAPRFHCEETAFEYVEAMLWPNGPVCPHCQATGDKIGRLSGKTTRPGLRKCYACRKQFTVRVGTIFEDSHLPLRLWLQAIHMFCASKKGISTRQLQRMLGCGMKTAWHLGHRIRLAMAPASNAGPLGGAGKTIEADEMEMGRSKKTIWPNLISGRTTGFVSPLTTCSAPRTRSRTPKASDLPIKQLIAPQG